MMGNITERLVLNHYLTAKWSSRGPGRRGKSCSRTLRSHCSQCPWPLHTCKIPLYTMFQETKPPNFGSNFVKSWQPWSRSATLL